MSHKLKALGVGLLAMVAMGAFAAMTASATVSGHFLSDVEHTIVDQKASAESAHELQIRIDGGILITCDEVRAFGTAQSSTVTEATGNTELKNCHTEGQTPGTLSIDMNGCGAIVKSGSGGSETADVECPLGKKIVVTHSNCTINVPPQSNITGFSYTTTTVNGKHAITVDVNITYTVHFHSGICIFTGTKHSATVTGSTVIKGLNTDGEQVNITAT